jgi:AraC-like DNA-binding protein
MKIVFASLLPKLTTEVLFHRDPWYEFHYVVSGKAVFESANRAFGIRRGDFFYNEPNVEHRSNVMSVRSYLLQYVVGLRPDPVKDKQFVSDLRRLFPQETPHLLGDAHHLFFEQIRRLETTELPTARMAALHRFIGLLYEVMSGAEKPAPGNQAMEEALRLIHSKVTQRIDLDELAGSLGFSKSYFVRLFKLHTGLSPIKYANNLRMEMAAELLRSSDLTLAEVAARVDFGDEYQFSRSFKQWSGMPPGRYRNSTD